MALTTEKKKQIAAAVLASLAVITIAYTLFFPDSSPASNSKPGAAGKKVIPGLNSPVNQAASTDTKPENQVIMVTQPLNTNGIGNSVAAGIGRNIFVYPTPTPPPPVKVPTPTPPPPPPPITLAGLNPNNVTAETADFSLTVFGAKIPADARVLFNGAPYPTTFVNETQVKVSVSASAIANPGALQVEVKSAADPVKWYSNKMLLSVAAPPKPQYRYLGLVVKNGASVAMIREETETDRISVKKGQKLGSRWQVTNITPNEIEITDVTINKKHHIPFSNEGG